MGASLCWMDACCMHILGYVGIDYGGMGTTPEWHTFLACPAAVSRSSELCANIRVSNVGCVILPHSICRFEDLRIRRETKSKNYSKEGGRKADKTKSARNDKTACLCFTATLQLAPNQEITLQVLSKPIQLCKQQLH